MSRARGPTRTGSARGGAATGRRAAAAALPNERAVVPAAAATRATLVLAVGLALLVVARAVLPFVPGMHLWSLNLARFVAPAPAWLAWLLAALALLPPLARRAQPALERLGDGIAGGGTGVRLGAGALAAALVLALPDRVRFVGDFLLRQGSIDERGEPGVLYPQALPLDAFLHVRLPAAVVDAFGLTGNTVTRLFGAFEAAVLALLALAFARALALRGAAAVAVAATVLFGGWLGLLTGYAKAASELTLVVVALGAFGLSAVRTGNGLGAMGVAFALGVLLHRAALGLLPAVVLAWVLAARREPAAPRRRGALAGAAVAVAALAAMLPRILATFRDVDVGTHFASPEVESRGGLAVAMLSGLRPLDLLNQLVWLAPVLPAALLALPALGRPPRRRELALLAALALPGVALLVTLHPRHGLHRDWDNAAPIAVALALIGAWAIGESLRACRPAVRTVALAVVLGCAAPVFQQLAHHADFERGLARARAFMTGPPQRTDSDRGWTWDWIGIRTFNASRWNEASEAFGHAVETAPSPRLLTQWAMAETQRGDLASAQAIYRRLLDGRPRDGLGWLGLAAVSSRLGDLAESERALVRLLELEPGNAGARDMLARVRAARAREAVTAPTR